MPRRFHERHTGAVTKQKKVVVESKSQKICSFSLIERCAPISVYQMFGPGEI